MFRSAAEIDSERTAAKVQQIQSHWEGSVDSWFDGSVESIDKRLSQCNRLIGQCRAASVRLISRPEAIHYIKLAHDLESDQRALTDMRHDLLYAAADREAGVHSLPWDDPENSRWKTEHLTTETIPSEEFEAEWAKHYQERPKGKHRRDAKRWVELESRNFFADNEDAADDLHELTTRAANYAALKTSTLSPNESRAITAAFTNKVGELGRKASKNKRIAAVQRTAFEDFEPELMY